MKISAVIPLYRCEPFVAELTERLITSLSQIDECFEIIFVNDKSPTNDWAEVYKACNKDSRVKGINLTRNFGQHYAITAGIDHAQGEWVVVMDGDLQDRPEDIINLYKHATENNLDVVWGRRVKRKHSFIKRFTSKIFFKVFDYLSGYKSDPNIANFSIIKRKVALAFSKMKEQNRAYPLFIRWLGFKVDSIDINHAARPEGSSSYNIRKLFRLAFDSILAYSNKPLKMGLYLGVLVSLVSALFVIYYLSKYFITGISVPGWTSLIVSLWFIFGVIMSFLGLIGLYLGKIFNECKGRPLYVVHDVLNL